MSKVIIQGIRYDEKSSYQKGAKLAPKVIREALYCGSSNLYSENGKSIEDPSIRDNGDFDIEDYFDIQQITKSHLDKNCKVFTLGGDHSITFPLVNAYHSKYTKFDILHIDAHADLYDSFDDDKHSHACPFARIMENKLADRLVQVGIRTLNEHQRQQAKKYNVEIHEMKNLDLSTIGPFKNPLYISLDMDAFDPAFAPGVSHHEPGGLTSRQVIDLIQSINTEIIGADIVEYNPKKDFQNMTAFLAAKMMKEILTKMI
ncbi:agmatinase [Aquimarina sp. 2201CG1-2-11]|uniref:agmatinase n=1 Tax=Aquimarina discodermiae TaxID=3231043 RepID=UPI003462BFCA